MTDLIAENLPNTQIWWRLADRTWTNPLDPTFAKRSGARWNPPNSFAALYLNEDIVTARMNIRLFTRGKPYEPEDLLDDTGPVLVGARLPPHQLVCDAHSPQGLAALGLPASYPYDRRGKLIPHAHCQLLGERVKAARLRGVRSRSAQSPRGEGRELAWFPSSSRSKAKPGKRLRYTEWYWT